jgi:hypothetical protein
MPPDHHRVLIKAPGYAVLWTDERRLGAEEIWDLGTIQLRRGGQARVQFDRAEVGDAALAIRVIDAALRPYWGVSAPGDVAHTERLVPGRYRLMVYGQGVATRSIPFAVREGEVTDVAVRPVRGWSCNVRAITDAEAVRITVAGEHGVILEWRIHRRRPGPLTMDVCLAPGRYSVTASADGGQEGRAAVEVVRDRPQTVDVRVE